MIKRTEDILLELGITPNLQGFVYICKAVEYICENPDSKMGEIYTFISECFDSSYSKVERSIRHAISKIDKKSDAYKKYVGVNRATNSAVLFTMALKIREEE